MTIDSIHEDIRKAAYATPGRLAAESLEVKTARRPNGHKVRALGFFAASTGSPMSLPRDHNTNRKARGGQGGPGRGCLPSLAPTSLFGAKSDKAAAWPRGPDNTAVKKQKATEWMRWISPSAAALRGVSSSCTR